MDPLEALKTSTVPRFSEPQRGQARGGEEERRRGGEEEGRRRRRKEEKEGVPTALYSKREPYQKVSWENENPITR